MSLLEAHPGELLLLGLIVGAVAYGCARWVLR